MGLLIINSGGITAYCSDLIVDEEGVIYFLSVAGYQTAVKGIIANVLEYGSVTVKTQDEYIYPLRSTETYSVHYQKLPSGLYQGLIFPKIALPGNDESKDKYLVLAEDRSMAEDLFFKHLEEKTEVPQHPIWSSWLWREFSERDWLISLDTLVGDYEGYLVEINEDELRDTITMAIANKNKVVIAAFKKGGKNGTDEQS
jgi:hypothetical protein